MFHCLGQPSLLLRGGGLFQECQRIVDGLGADGVGIESEYNQLQSGSDAQRTKHH